MCCIKTYKKIDYLCPITQDLMKDPVVAADGHSYEKESIL